jgi:hypothetical protein
MIRSQLKNTIIFQPKWNTGLPNLENQIPHSASVATIGTKSGFTVSPDPVTITT